MHIFSRYATETIIWSFSINILIGPSQSTKKLSLVSVCNTNKNLLVTPLFAKKYWDELDMFKQQQYIFYPKIMTIELAREAETSVSYQSRQGLEELQQICRNEPCLDLGPTPHPTLASNKEVL